MMVVVLVIQQIRCSRNGLTLEVQAIAVGILRKLGVRVEKNIKRSCWFGSLTPKKLNETFHKLNVGGGNSNMCLFSPPHLWKIPILTHIFSKGLKPPTRIECSSSTIFPDDLSHHLIVTFLRGSNGVVRMRSGRWCFFKSGHCMKMRSSLENILKVITSLSVSCFVILLGTEGSFGTQ